MNVRTLVLQCTGICYQPCQQLTEIAISSVKESSFEVEKGGIEANNDTQSDNLTYIVEGGNERIEEGLF